MQYREFGKTGIKISALGFGSMRLPQKKAGDKYINDVEEGIRVIQRAFELGVNYIDTAPGYCGGESEIIVGKALKGWRDKVYVSTKNSIGDSSPSNFRRKLEESLKKLDVDYIDFYHMWGIDWETYEKKINVPDGPLDAARKAKEEGLIKHISFSFHDKPENLIRLVDTGNFETLLCQYNLLDQANKEAIAYAGAKGMGVVIMGPVAGGMLGAPSQVIQNLIKGKVKSSAEIALRFVLASQGVTCALSGMSTVEMVEENAEIASREDLLSEEEINQINESIKENRKLADLYCTGCNYCMPCPNDVNIPRNFRIMNYHRIYQLTDYARDEYRNLKDQEKASNCIECGLCEQKCPQKIKIRSQLRETAETLG